MMRVLCALLAQVGKYCARVALWLEASAWPDLMVGRLDDGRERREDESAKIHIIMT